jgi:hypothetical protein
LPSSEARAIWRLLTASESRMLCILLTPENVWSAVGLQGKSLGDRQVCGNVFGL